jgi:hypothetical protein
MVTRSTHPEEAAGAAGSSQFNVQGSLQLSSILKALSCWRKEEDSLMRVQRAR